METRIDTDSEGYPYRSGEVLALDLDPAGLERVRELGYLVVGTEALDGAGSTLTTLRGPAGGRGALQQLHDAAPDSTFALNHIFAPAGAASARPGQTPSHVRGCACRVGMVDTGVSAGALGIEPTQIIQRAFGGASPHEQAHGDTVAGLLLGHMSGRDGLPAAASLYVADVFSGPQSGSAASVSSALAWLSNSGAPVINVSLTGPPNAVVARVIGGLAEHGVVVVAAAGNDGPAAPPTFPAAYPQVVAVTAVDLERHPYRYANRGPYVRFAALGVDIAAPGSGPPVSGTSFASPLVAVEIARRLAAPDREGAERAQHALQLEAVDLGAPGRDPVFGFGLIEPRP